MKYLLLLLSFNVYASDCLLDDFFNNQLPGKIHSEQKGNAYYVSRRVENRDIGFLSYSIVRDKAHVNLMMTSPNYMQKNVQKELFQVMFKQSPHIKKIDATLVETNFWSFEKVYKTLEGGELDKCKLALMKTPIYKIISKHGFIKITHCEVIWDLDVIRSSFELVH